MYFISVNPSEKCMPFHYFRFCFVSFNEIFFFFFFPFFWPCLEACEILVPQPGIEPRPSAVKALSPNPWTAREFPRFYDFF